MVLSNPLLVGMERVQELIGRFKECVRSFYFEVLLSAHPCPDCGARLEMVGVSRARCSGCGATLDPTVAFQRSSCCGAGLVLRRTHYACAKCGAVVPSMFLFDESVFDSEYFKQAMRESRERARERRERVRLMLLGTRSDSLSITELPRLNDVPGLADALAEFIQGTREVSLTDFAGTDTFNMAAYRDTILKSLGGCSVFFDAIPTVGQDPRKDRVRRFVTLVFMEQDREVSLIQYGEKIVVERYEAET